MSGIGRKPIIRRLAPAPEPCDQCKRMWDPRSLSNVQVYRSLHPGSFKLLCPECRDQLPLRL